MAIEVCGYASRHVEVHGAFRYDDAMTRAPEKWVEDLFDEAKGYECVHLAHAAESGRRELPYRAA